MCRIYDYEDKAYKGCISFVNLSTVVFHDIEFCSDGMLSAKCGLYYQHFTNYMKCSSCNLLLSNETCNCRC